jgi:hypothetical protein
MLLPLAPVSTLTARIAERITTVLSAHHAPAAIIDQERQHMRTAQLGVTANRSVVGVMTEFARLAEIHHDADPAIDLVGLAVQLARHLAGRCTAETSARIVNWPPPCDLTAERMTNQLGVAHAPAHRCRRLGRLGRGRPHAFFRGAGGRGRARACT